MLKRLSRNAQDAKVPEAQSLKTDAFQKSIEPRTVYVMQRIKTSSILIGIQ